MFHMVAGMGLCVFPVVFMVLSPSLSDITQDRNAFQIFRLSAAYRDVARRGTELDAKLGIRLFDRTTRCVALPKAGADLSHAARKRGECISDEKEETR